jgi:adenylate cyclase
MEACEKLATPSLSKAEQECDLYASGNVVVTRQNPPLMPAQPWVVRNRAVEQPFDANLMPMIDTSGKERIAKRYPHAARSKAFVMAPGKGWAYTAQSEPDDAVRRSLERCGATASSPCMVVAVDDTFVVPIPTLAKAIGFYRPDGLVGVTPAVRDEVARRLASAPNAWNAVAVGAGGNVGIALDADSELSALDGAMADCAKHDRNCRIAVMGPFLVELAEPEKQRTATP